ncbi:40S small subunit processome assembly factor 1 [Discoglossus pictus]
MGEGDGMTDQLDSVLGSLYDFGDDFVSRKKKTKKVTESSQKQDHSATETQVVAGSDDQPVQPTVGSKCKKKNAALFFKSLKDELQSQTKPTEALTQDASGDSASKQGEGSVEVVTFISHREKKKKAKLQAEEGKTAETMLETKEGEEKATFNFEKARLEVHKFGITGYKKEKQRTFEQERAIMLGARPPKKEYVNYKVYQEKVKEKRKTQQEEVITDNKEKSTKKRRKQGQGEKKAKKAKSSGSIIPTGQVGKFRNGALILSGLDIKKIKQSKVIK